jgi:hypothetical protein
MVVKQKSSILLVAQPGHLRHSLQLLLTTLSGGRPVQVASSWQVETLNNVNVCPVLVVVVLGNGVLETEIGADLTQIKTRWPQTRLIVLVDTEQQRQIVSFTGADRVWFKGTLAAQMLVEIEELLSGNS